MGIEALMKAKRAEKANKSTRGTFPRRAFTIDFKRKVVEYLFDSTSKKKRFHSLSEAAKRHFNVSLERQVISYWKEQYFAGNLEKGCGDSNNVSTPKYPAVEIRIVDYINFRNNRFQRDKCGLSQELLKEKAMQLASELLDDTDLASFKASNGWLHSVLKRNSLIGVKLHGEAGEISDELAETFMEGFRAKLALEMERHEVNNIGQVYNADQTGLFYQKIPNHSYIKKEERESKRGTKGMRDKNRVTLMVATSAAGDKVPLALVGNAKRPLCFRLCEKVPIKYRNQEHAWFDRSVMIWWLQEVFAPHIRQQWGTKKVILILDNFSAHQNLDERKLPENIILIFLPENLTSRHQPADLGIIALIKRGYKSQLIARLLEIYDDTIEAGAFVRLCRRVHCQ